MVLEFTFLANILTKNNLSADSIGSIEVMRGDRNLLEIKPSAWAHESEYGSHEGYQHFWFVSFDKVGRFRSSWNHSISPHRTIFKETTSIISQLFLLNRDVQFIVEIYEDHWDWEKKTPNVVIYKMQEFNWRNYCRHKQFMQG